MTWAATCDIECTLCGEKWRAGVLHYSWPHSRWFGLLTLCRSCDRQFSLRLADLDEFYGSTA